MQESRAITRKSASNLALAFVLLPREKRDAMSALYAFCREVDDIADDESVPVQVRRKKLQEWRTDIHRACHGSQPAILVNRELQPVIRQYKLPFSCFDELIQGVEQDLEVLRYDTFDALERYCYLVASVVGLLSIQVFEFSNPNTREYAVHLGKALQLTNILRDVRNDAERGRIYIPLAALEKAGVSPEEVLHFRYSDRFKAAASAVAYRADHFFKLAAETLPKEDRKSMAAAELMGSVYWQLLRKLKRRQFNVFGPAPVRLSTPHKICLILNSRIRTSVGDSRSRYGSL